MYPGWGKWNNEDKLRIVIETFALNEAELGQYCRERGLYSTDIKRKRWRQVLESSFNSARPSKDLKAEMTRPSSVLRPTTPALYNESSIA